MAPPDLQFSIVVPTYDRPEKLRTCLESIVRLEYPAERFEVVIVDDGSPVPVRAESLEHVHVIRIPNGGPGAARNAGAAVARGRYLAFTDDDCRPAPAWLRALDARLARHPDRMIGGRLVNRLGLNPWATTSQVIHDVAYAYYNADPTAPRFFASNNMAVPAEAFRRLGGFRTGHFRVASEDRELCDRWRHAGYQLDYAADAVVEHAHPLTLTGFCRQHFRYGRGAMRYHQARAQRGSGRLAEDVGFYARLPTLARARLAELDRRQAASVVFGLGLWQLFNTAGYVYERGRDLLSRGGADSG